MSKFHLFCLCLFLTACGLTTAPDQEKRYYSDSIRISKIISIYDGDTFRADIEHWPEIVGSRMPIRVRGIDTPELRGKCQSEKDLARKAKETSVSLLRSASVVELRNIERGKYFRLVADVYVDGRNLGQLLMNQDFARPYDGGTKISWC